MVYRVNFLVRLSDGTRATSPVLMESASPIGALTSALRRWDPPFEIDWEVYGINIREIKPRGSKKHA